MKNYIGRIKQPTEYTRTARIDLCEPVYMLVEKLCGLSDKRLKHRTLVDNFTFVFPLLKESYMGKLIEHSLSQNISLKLKDKVQSAHFS